MIAEIGRQGKAWRSRDMTYMSQPEPMDRTHWKMN
jgi:hypothetical protein